MQDSFLMPTEAIEEQVISMVFPEHSDLTVLVPQAEAVEEQKELDTQSRSDGSDGGYEECVGVRIVWPMLDDDT